MKLGYHLSCEEHSADELIDAAVLAEKAGLDFLMVSDHFHPWLDVQGEAPMVWPVLGGIAAATEKIQVGTGVVCPLIRMHPALVAQAAATAACLLPGRFFLGLGTGESLNEHILGDRWPPPPERLEMLEEAAQIIRTLHTPGKHTHRGPHYSVVDAQIHSLPDECMPIIVSAAGRKSAQFAARHADGILGVGPISRGPDLFAAFGGAGKSCYGKMTVAWATSDEEGMELARTQWPNEALDPKTLTNLSSPTQFKEATARVKDADLQKAFVVGGDSDKYLQKLEEFARAGYDHVYLHQVGDNQAEFLQFVRTELVGKVPKLARETGRRTGTAPIQVEREQVPKLIEDGAQLVEVLTATEYEREHIEGAVNIALQEIDAARVTSLDRSRPVIVYCYDTQ